jgi:hypothetical protein
LKSSKEEAELLTDYDMYTNFELGIRGGLCMVGKRYAKANNPLCPDFDPLKLLVWLIYLDVNNLYGNSMCTYLPHSNFRLVEEYLLDVILDTILKTADDADTGYTLKVDIRVPKHLHNYFSDFPLAPENIEIPEEELSEYQKNLINKLRDGKYEPCIKLVPNLWDKKEYVVHYRLLKYYVSKALIVTKVHWVVQYTQKPWLKKYIEQNTEYRKDATTKFGKDYFKLMNNVIYGKTMENKRFNNGYRQ